METAVSNARGSIGNLSIHVQCHQNCRVHSEVDRQCPITNATTSGSSAKALRSEAWLEWTRQHQQLLTQLQLLIILEWEGPDSSSNSLTAGLPFRYPDVHTHTLFIGFWDEFAFAVDAGVGTLPSNALLPLWNVPRGRWTSACVLGTWAREKDIFETDAYWNETARARTQNPDIHL